MNISNVGGKQCLVRVQVSSLRSWLVPGRIMDARQVYGRTDYLVIQSNDPQECNGNLAAWVASDRVTFDDGIES